MAMFDGSAAGTTPVSNFNSDFADLFFPNFNTGIVVDNTPSAFTVGSVATNSTVMYEGLGFVYDAAQTPIGGVVQYGMVYVDGAPYTEVTGIILPATTLVDPDSVGGVEQAIADMWVGGDRIIGSNGDDELNGFLGSDRLSGRGGDDTLYGGLQNDFLNGNLGADFMMGNQGNDRYFVDNPGDVVFEEINQGTLDRIDFDPRLSDFPGFTSYTLPDNVEELFIDGDDADLDGTGNAGFNRISGNNGDNVLNGLDGDDIINGVGGNDELNGGNGDDLLEGGSQDDLINGGFGNDTINGGTGDDEVNGDEGADDIDGQAGNDLLRGGDSDDTLNGATDDDSLFGNGGNDLLLGSRGNDLLFGGGGHDMLRGNKGDDFADGGSGNDNIQGQDGNDELVGGNGDDEVFGQAGDDLITGGEGDDTLSGGSGHDDFFFGPVDPQFLDEFDTIVDFDPAEDDHIVFVGTGNTFADLVFDDVAGGTLISGPNLADPSEGGGIFVENTDPADFNVGNVLFI